MVEKFLNQSVIWCRSGALRHCRTCGRGRAAGTAFTLGDGSKRMGGCVQKEKNEAQMGEKGYRFRLFTGK